MDENHVVVVAEDHGSDHHAHTHIPIVATFGRNYEEVRARARRCNCREVFENEEERQRQREINKETKTKRTYSKLWCSSNGGMCVSIEEQYWHWSSC